MSVPKYTHGLDNSLSIQMTATYGKGMDISQKASHKRIFKQFFLGHKMNKSYTHGCSQQGRVKITRMVSRYNKSPFFRNTFTAVYLHAKQAVRNNIKNMSYYGVPESFHISLSFMSLYKRSAVSSAVNRLLSTCTASSASRRGETRRSLSALSRAEISALTFSSGTFSPFSAN